MARKTLRDIYFTGALAMGYKVDQSYPGLKYTKLVHPDRKEFLFLGIRDSLRIGTKVTGSRNVGPDFRAKLFAASGTRRHVPEQATPSIDVGDLGADIDLDF